MRLRAALHAVTVALGACSLSLDGYTGGAPSTPPAAGPLDGSAPPMEASAGSGSDAGGGSDGAPDAKPLDRYGAAVRLDAPAAWYRLEDIVDSKIAIDEMGARPAERSAYVTFGVPGISGNAARFQPSGGLDVGDTFDFSGKVPFTLEFWAVAEQNNQDRWLVFKRNEAVDPYQGWLLYADHTTNEAVFQFFGADLFSRSDGPLPTDVFTHIVETLAYDGDTGLSTLWINGVAQAFTSTNTKSAPNTPQHLVLGQSWKGAIDEIAIYEHALTGERIKAHYDAARMR